MPDSEEEKIGKFMRAVSISARNKNEAEVHSQQDRLILLGPGSLQNWYEGRKSFDLLAQAIHQQIKVKDTYVSIQWLGYRDPGFSYSKKDTVIQSISDFAYQFDDFLKFYRRSVVDMVCHSLMGTIALYWAITRSRAKSDTVKRVRSITIINSPLRGSDKYWEAYKANFLEKNRPFLGSQQPPLVFQELRTNGLMRIIEGCAEGNSPVQRIINIVTEGDEIVGLDEGRVLCATQPHIIIQGIDTNRQSVHTFALQNDRLITTVIDILRDST